MRTVARILILIVCITITSIGAVRAQEWAEYKALQRWRVENPCFDNTGKWYAR